ncbi:hypothetical protein [Furfurilactobacillus rossiae]|nr:hypothetical protein [Furfurilactobacillus rossiae]
MLTKHGRKLCVSDTFGDFWCILHLKEDGANGVRNFYRIVTESDGKELPRVRKGCTAADARVRHVCGGTFGIGRSVNRGHYDLLLT